MRLVTRPDFDGLVCGALITAMEEIDSYLFVEPKFMQDGMVEIREGDIITNLPYHPDCTLWFDHHITNASAWLEHIGREARKLESQKAGKTLSLQAAQPPSIFPGKGGFRIAPSAARVVFEYYTELEGERRKAKGKRKQERSKVLNSERLRFLLQETDRIDAGLLSHQDVLQPQGYLLISMTINGRKIEEESYWLRLIDLLRDTSLEGVLRDKEVQRRCQRILQVQGRLRKILLEHTRLKGNVILVDLRGAKDITDANRYLLYTLFPKGNISIKIAADTQRANTTAISVGYNIFNTTSKVDVGALMQKYGGGGHRVVGSCRVPNAQAEKAVREILEAIKE
ncbi:MAG: hypothetical protein ACE5JU_06790 [Candidatus Binatia bacterium]